MRAYTALRSKQYRRTAPLRRGILTAGFVKMQIALTKIPYDEKSIRLQ